MVNIISYGIITTELNSTKRVAAKLNGNIVDLYELCKESVLDKDLQPYFLSHSLNKFITLDRDTRQKIKKAVLDFLKSQKDISNQNTFTTHLPLKIGGYTDFYASKHHAMNIGSIFRPDSPLLKNWLYLPIAYNGRASSVVQSGHPLKRPYGQILKEGEPIFSLSQKVDIEVELGIVIGKENALGEPISMEKAKDYIFGICVVNDWSLRDIQQWEYQPLGPFTSKSVLTSISSFVIPIEELEPFKVALNAQEPKPFPYLDDKNLYTYDIKFDVKIKTPQSKIFYKISEVNYKDIYWSMKQMIVQHTITGCNLNVGDLLASGTISSSTTSFNQMGSFMEMTVNGTKPIVLQNGEKRMFLLDGDELMIEAYNDMQGEKIALGCVEGKII